MSSPGWQRIDVEVKVSRTGARSITSVAIACKRGRVYSLSSEVGKSKSCSRTSNQIEFDDEFQTSMMGDGSGIFMGLKMAGAFNLSDMVLI
ncbi:putative aryl-alcohol dehydrogenase [Moniliophthora roreri]|nr:putative aryl-alcohol dehydrogenase [Moniliophthora roreri]KAI3619509.1 putative aryl-alcohol dehydrogenase [Moniliophthora roreri]